MSRIPQAPDASRGILERLGAAQSLALFFDYDGTLSPFAPRPELALLPEATRRVLQHLVALPRVTVGVISSRRLEDVAALVGIAELFYAGLSGLETRGPHGKTQRHPELLKSLTVLASLTRSITAELGAFPGAWLEDKQGTLAVHHRDVQLTRFGDLAVAVRKSLESHSDLLHLEQNAFTLEIRPTVDIDKGKAIANFLAAASPGALPMFAGDDVNDEPGLRKVRELGGVAIAVGPRAPAVAEYRLPSPEALCEVLKQLAASLESGHA